MTDIERFRLRTIASGLKLEALGLRRSRGPSCTKLAQGITGLSTRDRAILRTRLIEMAEAT